MLDDEAREIIALLYRLNKPVQKPWNAIPGKVFIAEPKYDGERCLLSKIDGEVNIYSVNGYLKNKAFPEVIAKLQTMPDNTVLDGELCIRVNQYKADLAILQTRSHLQDPYRIDLLSSGRPATFMAFDVLRYNDIDLTDRLLKVRKRELNHIVKQLDSDRIKTVPMFEPYELLGLMKEREMEGIVIKDRHSSYAQKWIKIKNRIEGDFYVKSFTSVNRPITALELVDGDGNYVGKVNYNPAKFPSTKEWQQKLPGMKAVVQFLVSGNNAKLRDPVLLDLREK